MDIFKNRLTVGDGTHKKSDMDEQQGSQYMHAIVLVLKRELKVM